MMMSVSDNSEQTSSENFQTNPSTKTKTIMFAKDLFWDEMLSDIVEARPEAWPKTSAPHGIWMHIVRSESNRIFSHEKGICWQSPSSDCGLVARGQVALGGHLPRAIDTLRGPCCCLRPTPSFLSRDFGCSCLKNTGHETKTPVKSPPKPGGTSFLI